MTATDCARCNNNGTIPVGDHFDGNDAFILCPNCSNEPPDSKPDLETAAREWLADEIITNRNGEYVVDEFEPPIAVIEHSAYAKALKRIEELESNLNELRSEWANHPFTKNLENENRKLRLGIDHRIYEDRVKELTKEREISKMLEDALEWISDETKRDHREPDLYTRYGCVLHKATETLTEVQKLRNK